MTLSPRSYVGITTAQRFDRVIKGDLKFVHVRGGWMDI